MCSFTKRFLERHRIFKQLPVDGESPKCLRKGKESIAMTLQKHGADMLHTYRREGRVC